MKEQPFSFNTMKYKLYSVLVMELKETILIHLEESKSEGGLTDDEDGTK